MELIVFIFLSVWLVLSVIGAIIVKNPVHSILFFLSSVLATAGIFFSLGAELIAGLQLIIYAVAIVVFYVLVITTIPWEKIKRFEGIYLGEFLLGLPFIILSVIFVTMLVNKYDISSLPVKVDITDNVTKVGKTLFTYYLFPFEVASVILLIAMIGAILLGRKEE